MTTPHQASAPRSFAVVIDREIFSGVSAFPLTPLVNGGMSAAGSTAADSGPGATGARIDEAAFAGLVARAAEAGVASIGVLGSTGSYMYLSAAERARVVQLAVQHAAGVPVLAGVGAISTHEVLEHVRAAEAAGAAGLIVAPVSYQRLGDDEVFELFRDVTAVATVPIVVYDNPGTTGFRFSVEMYGRVAALPGIASIKVPPPPEELDAARAHVAAIREVVPAHVTIGVSGDASAALGLRAGCDGWYSVVAGVLPKAALQLAGEVLGEPNGEAPLLSSGTLGGPAGVTGGFGQLLNLFAEYGSLRVATAVAEELGLVGVDSLPRPVLGLGVDARARVRDALRA